MKKIFTIGAKSNFLILIISYLAYPISLIFNSLRFSPNIVTFISFFMCLLSCYFFLNEDFYLFVIFWSCGSLLDFCDGQIARISGKINKTALNLDSLSDQLKIFLIVITSGIFYNDQYYWVISTLVIFLFPFFFALQSTLNLYNKKRKNFGQKISNIFFFQKFVNNLIGIFFKINGHTLFLFLLLIAGSKVAFSILLYLATVLILNILRYIYLLNLVTNTNNK